MNEFLKTQWVLLFCFTFSVRAISIFGLYFLDTPFGDKIADNWRRFLPHTIVFEAGLIAALFVLFRVLVHGLNYQEAISKRLSSLLLYALSILLGFHIILAQIDNEVMRWLGQHLNIVWLKTYASNPDIPMMMKIYADDIIGVAFSISCMLLAVAPTFYLLIKRPEPSHVSYRGTLLFLVIAIVGLTSKVWLDPSKMRWRKIQPATLGLLLDIQETQINRGPEQTKQDLRTFYSLFYPPKNKADIDTENPFYNEINATDSTLQDHLANRKRPNIVLIIMESVQGWSFDLRDNLVQKTLPNITALFKERGEFFPKCFSTGYPSVEGFSSLHLGVLTPPNGIFLTNYASIRTRSIAEILSESGGYSSQILTGAEPSFDNLYHSFRSWYDQHEYDPKKSDDLSMANWLVETHEADRKEPHFLTWMTASTHLPFNIPDPPNPNTTDMGEKYVMALQFMDKSIGHYISHLKKGHEWDNTWIIMVGDHSVANSWLRKNIDELGSLNLGHLWTSMLIAGPGVVESKVRTESVSHFDVAPTIMALSGIRTPNHFLGVDLRDRSLTREFYDTRYLMGFHFNNASIGRGNTWLNFHMADKDYVKKFDLSEVFENQSTYPSHASRIRDFHHGMPLRVTRDDLALVQRGRTAGGIWEWYLRNNKLMK